MIHWIWIGLVGLVVGAVAKMIISGRQPGGMIATMLIGIAGSMFATYLGQFAGIYGSGDRAGFIMSVIGAVLLLWLYKKLFESA